MATPLPTSGPEELAGLASDPAALGRTLEWAKVLDLPVGKKRFQAVRSMLKDYLQTESRAPNAAKKFLSEKLVTSVGAAGKSSALPRELRQILGASADDFAKEVQTGYYFLTGKAPGGPSNAAFKNMLGALQEAGMPAEHIATLRKIGPAKLIKMGGPGRAITALTEAQKDPAIMRILNWAGTKITGKAAAVRTPIPTPIADAAAAFKPSSATFAGLQEVGVKGAGVGSRILKGVGFGPTLAGGLAAYDIASTVSNVQGENERANMMAQTGEIPPELGGNAVIARDAKGNGIQSGQFLQMMQDRQDQMKLARFNAVAREGDLTRSVLGYLSGADEQDQREIQRVQLGSARSPALGQPKPSSDKMMQQFDSFLRQASEGDAPQM